MKNKTCPDPPENLLARCLETIPLESTMEPTQNPLHPELSLDLPSKRRLRWLALAAVIPAIVGLVMIPLRGNRAGGNEGIEVWGGVSRPQIDSLIDTVRFTPVPCSKPDCQSPKNQGKVEIVYANGRLFETPGDQVFHGNSEDSWPQVAPDHKTVGWLQGEHIERQKSVYFLPTQLVLFQNQRIIRTLHGDLAFIEAWYFWDGGKKVVFRSRRFHGVSTIELDDIASGKQLDKIDGDKVTPSSPAWAQKLKD